MEIQESFLIAECQAGRLENFSGLYDAYVQKIYNYLFYRLHHKETAEDLTSQVFLKALDNIRSFDPGKGNFSAWLYRIARNALFDHYRATRPTTDLETAGEFAGPVSVEREVGAREELRKVMAYLDQIPAHHREIVLLRVWDGLSYREIAEITGKTEASCQVDFSRTMLKLRQAIPNALAVLLLVKIFGNL